MTPLTDAVAAALLHSLWQDTLVAVLLSVGLATLRHRPHARYAAGCAALALMAVLPVLTAGLLYLRANVPELGAQAVDIHAILEAPGATILWVDGRLQQVTWLVRLQPWAVPLWSTGMLIFSLRLVGGSAHAVALRRRSEPADAGVHAMVARLARRVGVAPSVVVGISVGTDGPATLGWLRPMILLPPATILGLTPQQLEAVLAHELAHIKRHDYLVNVLQMVAETVFFYHPAIWWASSRIRSERELCCDDLAVGSCGDALCYAQALTKIAKMRVATMSLAVGATGGSLVQRIERLLGGTRPRPLRSQWPALIAVSLALAIAMLNATWIRAQVQSDELVYSGLWEIRPAATAGAVQLRLCYADLFSRAEIPVSQLGLSPARLASAGGLIRFALGRDAGTFRFEGTIADGGGAGTYTFEPAADFSRRLETRGVERPTSSLQHTLALHDLGLSVLDRDAGAPVLTARASLLVRQAQMRNLLDDLVASRAAPQRRSNPWC